MKRLFSTMLILVVLATFAFSTGTLTKPSERQGNIINGKEIANVYNLLKGDSTYSDISINGAVFSETGNITVDTLTVSVTVADTTLTTLTADSVITGAVTVSGNATADSMTIAVLTISGASGFTGALVADSIDVRLMTADSIFVDSLSVTGLSVFSGIMDAGTLDADSLNISGISVFGAGISGTTGAFTGDFSVADTLSVTDGFIAPTQTPSSSSDTGTLGQMSWDASFIYICTATDTWERVAIATW